MKLSRRKLLQGLGGFTLSGLIGACHIRWFEPYWLECTTKDIPIHQLDTKIKALHLSDFHASDVMSLEAIEKAIDLGIEQKPDMIFLTGDYITWGITNEQAYRKILSKLSETAPTFACIGNHDGGLWAGSSHGYKDSTKVEALLKSAGIHVLINQSERIQLAGRTIKVVGLGDLWSGLAMPGVVLEKQRSADEVVVVLSHNPDSKTELQSFDWDLTLCGHTHGGQLVVPILGLRPFLPVRDKTFPEGILSWENRHIHITRGVGNLHDLRFNCRPEVSLLNLVKA